MVWITFRRRNLLVWLCIRILFNCSSISIQCISSCYCTLASKCILHIQYKGNNICYIKTNINLFSIGLQIKTYSIRWEALINHQRDKLQNEVESGNKRKERVKICKNSRKIRKPLKYRIYDF